jgi:hypothetical protein
LRASYLRQIDFSERVAGKDVSSTRRLEKDANDNSTGRWRDDSRRRFVYLLRSSDVWRAICCAADHRRIDKQCKINVDEICGCKTCHVIETGEHFANTQNYDASETYFIVVQRQQQEKVCDGRAKCEIQNANGANAGPNQGNTNGACGVGFLQRRADGEVG